MRIGSEGHVPELTDARGDHDMQLSSHDGSGGSDKAPKPIVPPLDLSKSKLPSSGHDIEDTKENPTGSPLGHDFEGQNAS